MPDLIPRPLNQAYLFARQQYHHLQALWGHARTRPDQWPQPRFVLFGRGRSGTTALVGLLDSVPALRCEGEVLFRPVPFPRRHVLGRCARSPGPGYGCKILSYQIRDLQSRIHRPKEFLRGLHREHGFQVLYLRRTNLLRHALSNIRARREQYKQEKGEASASGQALHVDPANVLDWMRQTEALRDFEEQALTGVPYLSLTYEEHIRDSDRHQATVDEVCDFLGVESAPVESRYEKIAPRSLRDGVANYDALARRLRGTPYEPYLD